MNEELKTIDELMEGREPGSVKITCEEWNKIDWFIPHFVDSRGYWHGLDNYGVCLSFILGNPMWKIWTEPKKKVKMWQWVFKHKERDEYIVQDTLFKNKEDASESYYWKPIKRLDHTEITVDE